MHIVLMILEPIGLILGSLTLAFFVCLGFTALFRAIGHPDWGAIAALAFACGLLLVPAGGFVRVTEVLIALLAIPFWFDGRATRGAPHGASHGGGPAAPL